MAQRRRVCYSEEEKRIVREAHRVYPNNSEMRLDLVLNNPALQNLSPEVRMLYADRPRARRRVSDAVRSQINA